MEKRFREYRMFWFSFLIFLCFITFTVYCLIQKLIPQMICGIVLSMMSLSLMTLRFKIVLFQDMMMIYEWKVLAMLPALIEYKDIESVEKKSKHHVVINHKKKSHVYVFNSDEFLKAYDEIKA